MIFLPDVNLFFPLDYTSYCWEYDWTYRRLEEVSVTVTPAARAPESIGDAGPVPVRGDDCPHQEGVH